jgi:glycosyltransferase involved in cell wall biosynthesis
MVSIIIPARNEAVGVGDVVGGVLAQRVAGVSFEVIVVDDASTDRTAESAERAGARVLRLSPGEGGNPAAARNRGAAAARGDVLVFLDCDCVPQQGWLAELLAGLERCPIVGGSLGLPPGLSLTARADYYCGWYHVHPARPGGHVRQHPPGNLCVRREVFAATDGFVERQPIAYAHEELAWQAHSQRSGACIHFAPRAVVHHRNRPGLGNLLARNYRWGYSSIAAKAESGVARLGWLYRFPLLGVLLGPVVSVASTPYVIACWLRAGVIEPLFMLPLVFLARCSHGLGTMVGGARWLLAMRSGQAFSARPRWE